MADQEQLRILKQGISVWNKWREENRAVEVDLGDAVLNGANLSRANLSKAILTEVDLKAALLIETNFRESDLSAANLREAHLSQADLSRANLSEAYLGAAHLIGARLSGANLSYTKLFTANLTAALLNSADLRSADLQGAELNHANLVEANFIGAVLTRCNFLKAEVGDTIFGDSDLSEAMGLKDILHKGPSRISADSFARSKGKIPDAFLRGCGLSDADIEYAKLSDPAMTNELTNKIIYRMYELRASQAIQLSPLFISYSHSDGNFVEKLENHPNEKGIRYWRDVHDMKSGRIETQVDRAIRQNPTVLLILSKHSLQSDWVEHEVRTARELEKEMGCDVLCPIALDDSWKSSPWPKRVMEQVMEYNILDFSAWEDDSQFGNMFRKLIDGLGLFYKGHA